MGKYQRLLDLPEVFPMPKSAPGKTPQHALEPGVVKDFFSLSIALFGLVLAILFAKIFALEILFARQNAQTDSNVKASIEERQALTAFLLNDFVRKSAAFAAAELQTARLNSAYYLPADPAQLASFLCPSAGLAAGISSQAMLLAELCLLRSLYPLDAELSFAANGTRVSIAGQTADCAAETAAQDDSLRFLSPLSDQPSSPFRTVVCVQGGYCPLVWMAVPREELVGAEETLEFSAAAAATAARFAQDSSAAVELPFASVSRRYAYAEASFASQLAVDSRLVDLPGLRRPYWTYLVLRAALLPLALCLLGLTAALYALASRQSAAVAADLAVIARGGGEGRVSRAGLRKLHGVVKAARLLCAFYALLDAASPALDAHLPRFRQLFEALEQFFAESPARRLPLQELLFCLERALRAQTASAAFEQAQLTALAMDRALEALLLGGADEPWWNETHVQGLLRAKFAVSAALLQLLCRLGPPPEQLARVDQIAAAGRRFLEQGRPPTAVRCAYHHHLLKCYLRLRDAAGYLAAQRDCGRYLRAQLSAKALLPSLRAEVELCRYHHAKALLLSAEWHLQAFNCEAAEWVLARALSQSCFRDCPYRRKHKAKLFRLCAQLRRQAERPAKSGYCAESARLLLRFYRLPLQRRVVVALDARPESLLRLFAVESFLAELLGLVDGEDRVLLNNCASGEQLRLVNANAAEASPMLADFLTGRATRARAEKGLFQQHLRKFFEDIDAQCKNYFVWISDAEERFENELQPIGDARRITSVMIVARSGSRFGDEKAQNLLKVFLRRMLVEVDPAQGLNEDFYKPLLESFL